MQYICRTESNTPDSVNDYVILTKILVLWFTWEILQSTQSYSIQSYLKSSKTFGNIFGLVKVRILVSKLLSWTFDLWGHNCAWLLCDQGWTLSLQKVKIKRKSPYAIISKHSQVRQQADITSVSGRNQEECSCCEKRTTILNHGF